MEILFFVIVFIGIPLLVKVLESQERLKKAEKEIGIRTLYREICMRDLYWSTAVKEDKEAIKAFMMGYGFSGWHSVVMTESEVEQWSRKHGYSSQYRDAIEMFKRQGSPYMLNDHKVVIKDGHTAHF